MICLKKINQIGFISTIQYSLCDLNSYIRSVLKLLEVELNGCLETSAFAILNTYQVDCVNFHHHFFYHQYTIHKQYMSVTIMNHFFGRIDEKKC